MWLVIVKQVTNKSRSHMEYTNMIETRQMWQQIDKEMKKRKREMKTVSKKQRMRMIWSASHVKMFTYMTSKSLVERHCSSIAQLILPAHKIERSFCNQGCRQRAQWYHHHQSSAVLYVVISISGCCARTKCQHHAAVIVSIKLRDKSKANMISTCIIARVLSSQPLNI